MPAAGTTHLIYNPEAGGLRRNGKRRLREAAEVLARQGMPVQLRATEGPNTAGAIARRLVESGGVSRLLVAGGDGTVNEVLNGVVGLPVELGILPAGTANVLANELGIGRWHRALAGFCDCEAIRMPAGVLSFPDGAVRHFLMMAGAGFDARLVYSVNPDWKRRFGKLAYWLAGFSQLGRQLEQLRVCADGREYRGSFALASRGRNYGGDLEIAPSIRLLDNDLEVLVFEATVTATYLAYLASILAGRVRLAQGITVFRAKAIELHPDSDEPVHLQVDGEHAGFLPVRVSVRPDAITLLVPCAYLRRHLASAA